MVSITSALLPLLAFAGVASAADRACTTEHRRVQFNGNFLGTSTLDTSAQCAQACINTSNCVAYNYASRVCTTFSAITAETYNPTADASAFGARCMAKADLRLSIPVVENADYPGLDIGNAPAKTPTECSHVCQDTPGCLAFSWTYYNLGTCWMKSNKPAPAAIKKNTDGSVVSGQVYTCNTPRFDSDSTGTDLSNVLRSDWRDCCGVCRTTSGCAGFSWSNYNGGTCWLKSAVTGFTVSAGVTSAVL